MNYKAWKAVYIDKTKTWTEWKKEVQEKENSGKIVFKAATTIAEANAFAMDVLGIPKASYKGCDVETANAWNEGLTDSFNRFPELKKNFGFVGEAHERRTIIRDNAREWFEAEATKKYPNWDEGERRKAAWKQADNWTRKEFETVSKHTFAISYGSGRFKGIDKGLSGVSVNRDFGKDAKSLIESLTQEVSAKSSPQGCNTIRSLLDHEIGHQLDTLLGISKMPEVQKLINALDNEKITENLSRYAWKNKNKNPHREFIAEAWSEYCNNPEPRVLAKKIGELIESAYSKMFGG